MLSSSSIPTVMSSSSMPGLSSASSMSPNVSMPPVVISPVSNTSISVQGRTQSLKGANVSVPSTQPSDMELLSQYYERPKKYKRKFTPRKPINQKRSRPKLNCILQHACLHDNHYWNQVNSWEHLEIIRDTSSVGKFLTRKVKNSNIGRTTPNR
ncbi:hypothetical protein BDB01DRAFT_840180 [Pilobolus umbonatus]|nr:hypothetical protein BDB01DRAFT_840180 [Pilobolus umbonatus]